MDQETLSKLHLFLENDKKAVCVLQEGSVRDEDGVVLGKVLGFAWTSL